MAGGAFPQDDDDVRPFGVDSPEAHITNGEFDDRPWSSNHVHSLPQSSLDVPFDSANVLDRKSVLAGEAEPLDLVPRAGAGNSRGLPGLLRRSSEAREGKLRG
jgi:hypothetical protein